MLELNYNTFVRQLPCFSSRFIYIYIRNIGSVSSDRASPGCPVHCVHHRRPLLLSPSSDAFFVASVSSFVVNQLCITHLFPFLYLHCRHSHLHSLECSCFILADDPYLGTMHKDRSYCSLVNLSFQFHWQSFVTHNC